MEVEDMCGTIPPVFAKQIQLGEGGSGAVYRHPTHNDVVYKLFVEKSSHTKEQKAIKAISETIAQEVMKKYTTLLDHNEYQALCKVDGCTCVYYQECKGLTLKKHLGSETGRSIKIWKKVAVTLLSVLDAMANMTPQWYHNDISLNNIMVCGDHVKLIDFGSASKEMKKSDEDDVIIEYGIHDRDKREFLAGYWWKNKCDDAVHALIIMTKLLPPGDKEGHSILVKMKNALSQDTPSLKEIYAQALKEVLRQSGGASNQKILVMGRWRAVRKVGRIKVVKYRGLDVSLRLLQNEQKRKEAEENGKCKKCSKT